MLIELSFFFSLDLMGRWTLFSQVNIIKSSRRVQFSTETLNDLLTIATHAEYIEDFDPNPAIDLWWKYKVRRLNEKPRKLY